MNHQPFTIRCQHLSKSYGEEIRALKDLSLTLHSGEILSVLGANGAGKSTLVGILAGSTKPTKGEVEFVDDSQKGRPLTRSQVGLVAHATLLYSDLSGRENLQLYARLYGVSRDRVEEVISRCGLTPYADRMTRTYSRGMAQRTAIARAILHKPALLLCDEPYTGLDPAGAAFLGELLAQTRAEGTAIVLVTHDLEVAARSSGRVAILYAGRLVKDIKPTEEAPLTAALLQEALSRGSQ